MQILGAVLYGSLAVLFGAMAVGLFRLKNWARIGTLIISFLALFLGLIMIAAMFLFPIPQTVSARQGVPDMGQVRAIMSTFSFIFFLAIPLAYIILLSVKSIRVLFTGETTENSEEVGRGIPLGIKMIGALNCLSAFNLVTVWFHPVFFKIQIGPLIIGGIWSRILFFVTSLATFFIGIGFFKLKKSAWIGFIALSVYGACILLANIIFLNPMILKEIIPDQQKSIPWTVESLKALLSINLIWQLALLWYTIKKKKHFTT